MKFFENLSFSQKIVFFLVIFIFFLSTFKLILNAYLSTKKTIHNLKKKNHKS